MIRKSFKVAPRVTKIAGYELPSTATLRKNAALQQFHCHVSIDKLQWESEINLLTNRSERNLLPITQSTANEVQ